MNADEVWALNRLVEFPELEECASARVTIDRITHRAMWTGGITWRTLCRAHELCVQNGRFVRVPGPSGWYDFSVSDVDCMSCLPAGG